MGYTDRGVLRRVQIPLALPVIVAGIRVAAVTTVGLVTVTFIVGYGDGSSSDGVARTSPPRSCSGVLSALLAVLVTWSRCGGAGADAMGSAESERGVTFLQEVAAWLADRPTGRGA